MAISLLGKIVTVLVTLAVIAGLTVVIVFLVRSDSDDETTTAAPTTTTEPVFEDTLYDVGVGIADMTAPCVEIVFMGYADVGQTGRGLHTRQFSRAFIFVQGDKRVVLVTADVQSIGIHVRRQLSIVAPLRLMINEKRSSIYNSNLRFDHLYLAATDKRLDNNVLSVDTAMLAREVLLHASFEGSNVVERWKYMCRQGVPLFYGTTEVVRNLQEIYGDTYTLRNVIITGTHTHSSPGGYLVNFLLDVSARGFSSETFNAYVDGITRSIVRAHANIVPARLFYGQTIVIGAQKNRSPYSYNRNPPEELARYDSELDQQLTQLRIVKQNGDLHGVLNWFALHTTSMNMTNRLVSSDNLGYAAIRMEKTLNPNSLTGKPEIVAGFFTANLGDVSPNIEEARCEFSGEICDNQFIICGAGERCFAGGPGEDMFESTKIIGTRVYEGAMEVLSSPGEELTGDIAVVHQFINMPEEVVPKYDPVTMTFNASDLVHGCSPALGYSFASGTTDGANTLNITQGTLESDDFWDLVAGLVAAPTEEDNECHLPKPILLATGRTNIPTPWHPRIVSASLIMLGGLVVVGVPGEPTTMAGRRMREVVGHVMEDHGIEPRVVVSGLTNEYIHYVATIEEYAGQRYEAASTIYGPYTLDIFLNKFAKYAAVAIEGSDVPEGPEPGDYINSTLSLNRPVIADSAGLLQNFGDVVEQPPLAVRRGETVSVTFVGANPRNDLKQESTFLLVERLELGQWTTVATDADWETRFIWERVSVLLATSRVTIEWEVPLDAMLAPHRITYYGASRTLFGAISQFSGQSNVFIVDDHPVS